MLVSRSALAAVVFAACTVHTHAAGCYPAWTSGGTIAAGSLRSNSVTTTATKMENCSSGTSGCVDGKKKVETSMTTYTNYACVNNANSAFCGSAGYEPGTANGNIAWTATGTCDVSFFLSGANLRICDAVIDGSIKGLIDRPRFF